MQVILHICRAYSRSKLYSEFVTHLADRHPVKQVVYVPVRTKEEVDKNKNLALDTVEYHYGFILREWHRLFFTRKTTITVNDILSKIDITKITIIHAHYLFSDGAVAYKLHQQFGIPYVVAVRNTDIYSFMKYRPDLNKLLAKILQNASKVILITPAYKQTLLSRLPKELAKEVASKIVVIPNGLPHYWQKNIHHRIEPKLTKPRFLYVGKFDKNKNTQKLLNAAYLCSKETPITLTLVGSGGSQEKNIDKMLSLDKFSFVTKTGRIDDFDQLLRIYRSHDIFIMTSIHETFGITFIEALSQGLPLIYSKGQGIDGYFKDGEVGESVDPKDTDNIKQKMLLVIDQYTKLQSYCVNSVDRFNWTKIVDSYYSIYKDLE